MTHMFDRPRTIQTHLTPPRATDAFPEFYMKSAPAEVVNDEYWNILKDTVVECIRVLGDGDPAQPPAAGLRAVEDAG